MMVHRSESGYLLFFNDILADLIGHTGYHHLKRSPARMTTTQFFQKMEPPVCRHTGANSALCPPMTVRVYPRGHPCTLLGKWFVYVSKNTSAFPGCNFPSLCIRVEDIPIGELGFSFYINKNGRIAFLIIVGITAT